MLSFAIIAEATIINVDNKPNRPSGYVANLSAAISNASAGDTIFIYPSNTTYGSITVTKKLHLFGFGYDGTDGYNSTLNYLYLDTTSTPSSNPTGTTIQGLDISYVNGQKPNITNITIAGNRVRSYVSVGTGCSNWIIKNNYFENSVYVNNATSIVISNNVFRGHSYGIQSSNSSSVVISHN